MKKLIILSYVFILLWTIIVEYRLTAYRKDVIQAFRDIKTICLVKPYYNAQGSLVITPDGSGYIPILFKDKDTLDLHKTITQWSGNDFPEGYYDISKIYIRNKRSKK